jgi:RNA polymerase sigma factor (sigma-70 family)
MVVSTTYIDEQEKLQLIALGDKKGLEWLYKHSFSTTKKMVIKYGGDEDEAWDVFQDAVTVLFDQCKQENFGLNCRINTYITAIARNLWLKKKARNPMVSMPEEWEVPAQADADIDGFLLKEKQYDQLHDALEALGAPCNTLLKAFYFQKKSMQEISADFGYTNAENAKNQKFKCLARLKKIFNKEV